MAKKNLREVARVYAEEKEEESSWIGITIFIILGLCVVGALIG